MKKFLRIICLVLAVLLALSVAACGKNAKSTKIFTDEDLSEYVTLGKYKGITVDTKSEEYKAAYAQIFKSDVDTNDLYVKKNEGQVALGDIANIDYEGKKDGVAFAGGTASGHDLEIGSHSFIDGFEDGLIGVNIGDTVDLNLTFPNDYGNAELAGAAVVFTVKVNYVKSTDLPDEKDIYAELDYKSEKTYKDDLNKRTAISLLINQVVGDSKVESIPEKDIDIFLNAVYDYYNNYYLENNNMSFEQVLKNNSMTVDSFKTQMSSTAEAQLKNTIVSYAILQKEGIKADYELKDKEKVNQDVMDEMTSVENSVRNFIYENAIIK